LVEKSVRYAALSITACTQRKGQVLYITGCPGGSYQYRVVNQSEELKERGIRSAIIPPSFPWLTFLVRRYDVFILQRVIWNDHIENFLDEAKKQGKTVLFETDDLVFDLAYLPMMDYYQYMGAQEKSWYENGIGREFLEDPFVGQVVVSTDPLAEAVRKKYPEKTVWVSYNKMGSDQVKAAEAAYQKKQAIQEERTTLRLGYFSGSKSHNKDFETIAPVIVRILGENPAARLVVVGHLELDARFVGVMQQVEMINFVPLKKLPELIASVDINLAPLEGENPFCQAKSAVKYWEAGIVGVPTVAAATPDFVRCIRQEENGFVATTEADWYEALTKLIQNVALRKKIGQAAREDVLVHHVATTADSSRFREFLLERLNSQK
jgi:glycosyltransferase involved in cell wall biosynthesis